MPPVSALPPSPSKTSGSHRSRRLGLLTQTQTLSSTLYSTFRPIPNGTPARPIFSLRQIRSLHRPLHQSLTKEERRFSWGAHGTPWWMYLRTERVQEVITLPDDRSEYRTWESMAGWSAAVLGWLIGAKLDELNATYCGDLKKRVEQSSKDRSRRTAA